MGIKDATVQLIERGYQQEQALIAGLSEQERAITGTLEQWSAKDVIAHCATWKDRLAQNLLAVSQGRAPSRAEDFDQANAEIFTENQNKSWEEVLRCAKDACQSLIERINAMSEDELKSSDILPWQEERAFWRLAVGNAYSHPLMHLAEYYTKRGEKQCATELVEGMAEALLGLDADPAWQGVVKYNLACHYSLVGEKARAISGLRTALRLNPELTEWSKQDADFNNIREDAEYRVIYD